MTTHAATMVEMAPFRLKAGISEDEMMAAAARIEADFLARQPGFLRRDLVAMEDGRYADIILWADKASMEATMAKVETSPACGAYFALMDFDPATDAMLVMRSIDYRR